MAWAILHVAYFVLRKVKRKERTPRPFARRSVLLPGSYRAASINSMFFLSSSLTSWLTSTPRALARSER